MRSGRLRSDASVAEGSPNAPTPRTVSPGAVTLALTALGFATLVCYTAVALLSRRFVYGEGFTDRPIIAVLGWLAAAFVCHLMALCVALRGPACQSTLGLIVGFAILFRLVLLPSTPIQEIDIYRYIWDGEVASAGVSPYRFTPEQIALAGSGDGGNPELQRLVTLRNRSGALQDIASRVHFGQLSTPYPPVSQAVFFTAARSTPVGASLETHVVVMKAWLVAFDVGVLLLVVWLLGRTGRHPGWAVLYGWSPLVLKEFANSGHLDSVCVFLTTAAIALVVGVLTSPTGGRRANFAMLAATLLMALAVGAKLYPIVLAPLLFGTMLVRGGRLAACVGTLLFSITVVAVLWPMAPRHDTALTTLPAAASQAPTGSQSTDPGSGLGAFLKRWEMNDFIFLVIVENLKPSAGDTAAGPWFSLMPESLREAVVRPVANRLGVGGKEAAFVVTRAATGLAFVVVMFWLAWCATRNDSAEAWLEAAFLTLAWFWLLAPTQNPWYWTWALPLVAFARGRAWIAVGGLVLLYYSRFWLEYHWPISQAVAWGYHGTLLFDFVVTWFEFGPWLAWLAIAAWLRRRKLAQRW